MAFSSLFLFYGLRAKLAQGLARLGAGSNKRDFSGFDGGRNLKNLQMYRHLYRLPFSGQAKIAQNCSVRLNLGNVL